METLILLLLFALSDKKESLKESLQRFLCFYKENRELIQMLANMFASPKDDETGARNAAEPDFKHEENRPREEVGNLNILEEYLRRANA